MQKLLYCVYFMLSIHKIAMQTFYSHSNLCEIYMSRHFVDFYKKKSFNFVIFAIWVNFVCLKLDWNWYNLIATLNSYQSPVSKF